MLLKDGTRLDVYDFPEGSRIPAVVLIHGDGQNHTALMPLIKYFLGKGHPVLSYDRPGHGLSEPYKDKHYSYARFAETEKEIVDYYKIGKPLLVGNSSGGIIALQYAAKYDVRGVVCINACDETPVKGDPQMEGIIENYLAGSEKSFVKQELFDYSRKGLSEEERSLAALKHTHPEAIRGNVKVFREFNLCKELPKIKSPVLLLFGDKDPFISKESMQRMKDKIRKSKIIVFEGYGHNIVLDEPVKVISAIEENYSFLVHE
ncbi:alpha/beta hydrolase [Candidatus Woesearchaeota archaeon]|nr:alpha/beta hydrolase [Candidatus Woesearchaeota archaeon]